VKGRIPVLIDELDFYTKVAKFLENVQIDEGAVSVEDAYSFALEQITLMIDKLVAEGVEVDEKALIRKADTKPATEETGRALH